MENLTITELINKIRSNEDTIHRLNTIDSMIYDLKWNDSDKFICDDKILENIDPDKFLEMLDNFVFSNINYLMKQNKDLFKEIIQKTK